MFVEINNVYKRFNENTKYELTAVNGVSLQIYEGETLGLVGESGCGKTTMGRLCTGLYEKTSGQILYRGKDISTFSKKEKKKFDQEVQMIFQDPYSSLNPRLKVLDIVAEGLDNYRMYRNKNERKEAVYKLLEKVGLEKGHANRYISEFSGGQRQRIGIARSLAVNPSFIVCDEPISALDVSIQAQIVNLLIELQEKENLTYLFISHDLSMVKYITDRVAVMYLGEIVEITSSEKLYTSPAHPYTEALISAIPIPDPKIEDRKQSIILENEADYRTGLEKACSFCNRCSKQMEICMLEKPKLKEIDKNHFVACHLYNL